VVNGNQKVLYILGTSRGGSTILGRVLGTCPGFGFAGEVRRLWEHGVGPGRTCGCGLTLAACPVWSEVLRQVLIDGVSAEDMSRWQRAFVPTTHPWRSTGRLLRRDGGTRDPDFSTYQRAMSRMWHALGRAYDSEIVVDSSKLPGDAAVMVSAPEIRPYLLHLIRDARGVLASQLRRREGSTLRRWRQLAYGVAAWDARHLAAGRLRRSGAPYLAVRYEDFVAEPTAVLRQICDFVGAAPNGSVGGEIDLAQVHTPRGSAPARTVTLTPDLRWHEELSAGEARAVQLLGYPWQRVYRYRAQGSSG